MRLYDESECKHLTKYSRAQRWRMEKEGRFPKRVKLGERRIAWVADEVDEWASQRAAERDAEAAPKAARSKSPVGGWRHEGP
jgi:prophage regulatory protein